MDIMQAAKATFDQVNVLAEVLGGKPSQISFDLYPGSPERAEAEHSKLWNRAAAQEKCAELEALGWKKHWDAQMGNDQYICLGIDMQKGIRFMNDQIRIFIYYKQTNEEKCAALKQQLADLGCHY